MKVNLCCNAPANDDYEQYTKVDVPTAETSLMGDKLVNLDDSNSGLFEMIRQANQEIEQSKLLTDASTSFFQAETISNEGKGESNANLHRQTAEEIVRNSNENTLLAEVTVHNTNETMFLGDGGPTLVKTIYDYNDTLDQNNIPDENFDNKAIQEDGQLTYHSSVISFDETSLEELPSNDSDDDHENAITRVVRFNLDGSSEDGSTQLEDLSLTTMQAARDAAKKGTERIDKNLNTKFPEYANFSSGTRKVYNLEHERLKNNRNDAIKAAVAEFESDENRKHRDHFVGNLENGNRWIGDVPTRTQSFFSAISNIFNKISSFFNRDGFYSVSAKTKEFEETRETATSFLKVPNPD